MFSYCTSSSYTIDFGLTNEKLRFEPIVMHYA